MPPHDFAHLYRSKTDDELLQLASDSNQLAVEALSALKVELANRRIAIQVGSAPQAALLQAVERSHAGTLADQQLGGVRDFVEYVLQVYRSHFWSFIKLTAPAVLVGYAAVQLARAENREIIRSVRGGFLLMSNAQKFEIALVRMTGYLVSWMAFSFSFAAICSAVDQILRSGVASLSECFDSVRKKLGSIFRVAAVLFLLYALGMGLIMAGFGGIYWMLSRFRLQSGPLGTVIVLMLTFAFALVLSRFSLAIPDVVLADSRVARSIFRSDELTEGKWLQLAALLAKSLVGGYIGAMLPFWVRSWIWSYIQVPAWIATVLSFAAVIVIEPTMFIGFAVMYLQNTRTTPASRPTSSSNAGPGRNPLPCETG